MRGEFVVAAVTAGMDVPVPEVEGRDETLPSRSWRRCTAGRTSVDLREARGLLEVLA